MDDPFGNTKQYKSHARSCYIIDPRHSKDHIHTSLVITIDIDSVMCLVGVLTLTIAVYLRPAGVHVCIY